MPLSLEIITPEGIAWESDDVKSVAMPTRSGEVQLLEGHIPLMTILEAGDLRIETADGVYEDLAVDKGYARCMADKISILTEAAIKIDDIDINAAEEAKAEALKALEEAKSQKHLDSAEQEKLESIVRFSVAQQLAKARRKK